MTSLYDTSIFGAWSKARMVDSGRLDREDELEFIAAEKEKSATEITF